MPRAGTSPPCQPMPPSASGTSRRRGAWRRWVPSTLLGLGPSVSHLNCLVNIRSFLFSGEFKKIILDLPLSQILLGFGLQTCIMTWNLRPPAADQNIPPGNVTADQKPQPGWRLHCWIFPSRRYHPGDGHLQQPGEDVGVQGQQGQSLLQCLLPQLVLSCCSSPCTPFSCMLLIMKAPSAGTATCLHDAGGSSALC